ncbi:MAG: ABC transporter ATP-binding protein [Clostridia bacterium]|nr:ABC transporter ATP-binding protein [Clostridia bacterium]
MEDILELKNVSKTFRISAKQRKIEHTDSKLRVAVSDLSFGVEKGEIFGLLGPNGAGKTTTLRMISTLIRPDSGDIVVDGSSAVSSPWEVRSKIGFLTSELKLEDFFTPNYIYDFFSSLHNVDENVRDERKRFLFEKFGIDRFAEVRIANLSTGMKQKLSIAVSLVHDPDIIIFDEPTNGLDVITSRTVTDFLLELRGRGKTIIVSTHIFSLVEKLCDRVGILIDGVLVACGSIESVADGMSLEDRFFDMYRKVAGKRQ